MLDVHLIARWTGCVGGTHTTIAPIVDAKHDVFLSLPEPRAEAYRELDRWLDRHLGDGNDGASTTSTAESSERHRP